MADILYKAKFNETETKLSLLLSLCKEALDIIQTTAKESDEIRILKRFLNEQSVPGENGKPVPKKNKDISLDFLRSAYDKDATFRKKGKVSQSGYVLQVSETCSKENTVQFITDYAVKPNNVSEMMFIRPRKLRIFINRMCGNKPSKKIAGPSLK